MASFDFVESAFVARVYSLALQDAGVPVRLESNLGPRELVSPALRLGLVDVVPEYLGTALESAAPNVATNRHDEVAVRARLDAALHRWGLRLLASAPAENQNAFVVTRRTADRLGLYAVSDLARVPRGIILGGPPECADRAYCEVGLREFYGVHVRGFVPLENQSQTLAALDQGVVDVAVMFTTDGALDDPGVVALADDRNLQPVENVTPVVSARTVERYGSRLVDTLNAVSGNLTSESLRLVNWRIIFAGRSTAEEARAWLIRHRLAQERR